jgi:hypothetical protein
LRIDAKGAKARNKADRWNGGGPVFHFPLLTTTHASSEIVLPKSWPLRSWLGGWQKTSVGRCKSMSRC